MIDLVPVGQVHAELLAGMHKVCFARPWDASSMAGILAMPGTSGLIAVAGGSLRPSAGGEGPAGLVLWRVAADEAEILTIAVLPPWRRAGLGRRLLDAAVADARAHGAAAMFLEVAADNPPGLELYRSAGFGQIGLRKGYYAGIDALAMRLDLAQ